MSNKWTSRKFWICVASFLGSIGTSIAGLCIQNETVTVIGLVCTIISTAIYSAAEALVDVERIKNAEADITNK